MIGFKNPRLQKPDKYDGMSNFYFEIADEIKPDEKEENKNGIAVFYGNATYHNYSKSNEKM